MKKNTTQKEDPIQTFLSSIKPPYNIVEASKLGVELPEEFKDKITDNVMNFPVTLNDQNFDFDTLDMLDVDANGFRSNPYTRQLFKLADLQPNLELYTRIRGAITTAQEARKNIIGSICKAAQDGDVIALQKLFADNPLISFNAEFSNGFTVLHYACKEAQLGTAKYLFERGAELDFLSSNHKTPFSLIFAKNTAKANELRQHLIHHLQQGLATKDAACHIAYAKYLLNGRVVEQNTTMAIKLLKQAGDLGDVNGYIECADIYANGLYGVKKSEEMAILLYDKAIEHDSMLAKIKRSILYIVVRQSSPGKLTMVKEKSIAVHELAELAAAFNPEAQFLYSFSFKYGFGVVISSYKHLKYLKYAADHGLAIAQVYYGECLEVGDGTKINLVEAAKYYKMAADQGLAIGQTKYGMCLLEGFGLAKNSVEAIKYYKMAADQGGMLSQFSYASCMDHKSLRDSLTPYRAVEQLKYFKMAADQGHAKARSIFEFTCSLDSFKKGIQYIQVLAFTEDEEAQFSYAECCAYGLIFEQSFVEAAKFYKLAADRGAVQASLAFKQMGFDKKLAEQVKSFKADAELGQAKAQYNYAICCEQGFGVDKSLEQARKYYKLAADQGLSAAQFYYAKSCKNQHVDPAEAAMYYEMAANQGHFAAQEMLESMKSNIYLEKSAKHFKIAADMGDEPSQYCYARCCAYGLGVAKSLIEAKRYYKMAADQGHAAAIVEFGKLDSKETLKSSLPTVVQDRSPAKLKH